MHLPAPDTLACSPRKLHSWIWEAERTGEGRGGKGLRKGSGEGNEGEIEGEEWKGGKGRSNLSRTKILATALFVPQ